MAKKFYITGREGMILTYRCGHTFDLTGKPNGPEFCMACYMPETPEQRESRELANIGAYGGFTHPEYATEGNEEEGDN